VCWGGCASADRPGFPEIVGNAFGSVQPTEGHFDFVTEGDLVASAVLSGNRNFEGRVNPQVKANYLASPPLVVAYALAGTTDIDLTTEPLGQGSDGADVFLKDIWPTNQEISDLLPHSPAKRGPLARPISFGYIADDLERNLDRMAAAASYGMDRVGGAFNQRT